MWFVNPVKFLDFFPKQKHHSWCLYFVLKQLIIIVGDLLSVYNIWPSVNKTTVHQSGTFDSFNQYVNSIQILTDLRSTVKIIGPRWCQNHDYPWSEAEGIGMVLTLPRAYNFKLCPNKKQSIFGLYTEWKEQHCQLLIFESITHFEKNPHFYLKMRTVHAACDFRVITARKHWRECRSDFDSKNTTHAQLRLTVCLGHSHYSGHSQNYARSFNQSDSRNLRMRYIVLNYIWYEMYICNASRSSNWMDLNFRSRSTAI